MTSKIIELCIIQIDSKHMFDEKIIEGITPVIKDVYDDGIKPILQPTGQVLSLIPRVVHAVLSPIKEWVLVKEHNLLEIEKLLGQKLNSYNPEHIVSPEAHIAVPALQYIGYCMNNIQLREMYANLLAHSMVTFTKDAVHPAFVEIIKQLNPDEAKILQYIYKHGAVPIISVRREDNKGSGVVVLENFSDVGELVECDKPLDISKYFDNLLRLRLIIKAEVLSKLSDQNKYELLMKHPVVVDVVNTQPENQAFTRVKYIESFMRITDFGSDFCSICIESPIENKVDE